MLTVKTVVLKLVPVLRFEHCTLNLELKQELLGMLQEDVNNELWWYNDLWFLSGTAGWVILNNDVLIYYKPIFMA